VCHSLWRQDLLPHRGNELTYRRLPATMFRNGAVFDSQAPHNVQVRMQELAPKQFSSVDCPTSGAAPRKRCRVHSGSLRSNHTWTEGWPHGDLENKKMIDTTDARKVPAREARLNRLPSWAPIRRLSHVRSRAISDLLPLSDCWKPNELVTGTVPFGTRPAGNLLVECCHAVP
jgi:hypothetical protein